MRNTWAEERWLYVDRLFSDGEFAEGRNVLEAILEEDPGFGRAHSFLGWFYYTQLGDYRTAMTHLELAVRFAPEYAPAHFHLVVVLMERRMYGHVAEAALRATKVDATEADWMWEMRGYAMERIDRFSEARIAFGNAIRESTNDENIVRYRASLARVNRRERENQTWMEWFFS